jgi:hypoxanthine phosphoribosyltransferase
VICQFVQPESKQANASTTEIFYTPEIDVSGKDVLLIEALIQSGVTSDFLIRNLLGRGAASVKLAVLLDKQAARRVSLQPDYFGFLVNDNFVVGYGLGAPQLGRNLPYIAAAAASSTKPS